MLEIDGSYGEGGGQVLRTSLALSAVTGEPVQIVNIRAGRRKPGLRPQHLTAVRAVARVCSAQVEGDRLHSQVLTFVPGSAPQAGEYTFDVAQAAKGGSAGAVSLILQAVLMPLVLAEGPSHLVLRGGTHVAWSPPFDYLKRVYLTTLVRMGVQAKARLEKWGWYPIGGGEVEAWVEGRAGAQRSQGGVIPAEAGIQSRAGARRSQVQGLDLRERGRLLRVRGVSASSNLPKHIRTRQEGAALHGLRSNGINARIDVVDGPAKGQGTVVFLWAEFENAVAGFTSLGERGKPAERVAEEAVDDLLAYLESGAAVDRYLADQLVLPLALTAGRSELAVEAVSQHLLTNAWVVNQFLPGCVRVEGAEGGPGTCTIDGVG